MKFIITKILFALFILISFGCAGGKVERTVQEGNVFYSSRSPKITIKINPDFKLTDETDKHGSTRFVPGLGLKTSNMRTSNYFFIDQVSGKHRAVQIVIRELNSPNWSFKSKIFSVKNKISEGEIKIHGKKYQCCTYVSQRPYDFVLVQGIGKLVGANANAMIVIYYLENVTGNWSDINTLTSSQQEILNDFIEASQKDVQILK